MIEIIRLNANISILKQQRDDALEHAHNCIRRSDARMTRYWMNIYKDIIDSLDIVYKETYRIQAERKKHES